MGKLILGFYTHLQKWHTLCIKCNVCGRIVIHMGKLSLS